MFEGIDAPKFSRTGSPTSLLALTVIADTWTFWLSINGGVTGGGPFFISRVALSRFCWSACDRCPGATVTPGARRGAGLKHVPFPTNVLRLRTHWPLSSKVNQRPDRGQSSREQCDSFASPILL